MTYDENNELESLVAELANPTVARKVVQRFGNTPAELVPATVEELQRTTGATLRQAQRLRAGIHLALAIYAPGLLKDGGTI